MRFLPLNLLPLLFAPLAAEPVAIGTYPAKVVPEQLSVFPLPDKGEITDIADSSQRLEKGTIVAIVNKEDTEHAREELELQIIKERIAQRDELRKLRSQREKLLFYLRLSEDERKYSTETFEGGREPDEESLHDIDERIELGERQLNTLERRRRAEFARKHDRLTLRMPFRGRLQYNVTLPEDTSVPFELPGTVQTFATACDDSNFYITLPITQGDLTLLPVDKFSARVQLPEGKSLEGSYAFRRVERAPSGGDMLVYFFRLPAEDAEKAFSMLGSNIKAQLLYEVEGEVQRITKVSLATHPEAARCQSWAELVALAHPGAVVVIVAEDDVVIRRPRP